MDKKDDMIRRKLTLHGRFWKYLIWVIILWLVFAYFFRQRTETVKEELPSEKSAQNSGKEGTR